MEARRNESRTEFVPSVRKVSFRAPRIGLRMDCPAENTLIEHFAGTLPAERRVAVAEHVATCATCHLVFAELAADPAGGWGGDERMALSPGTQLGRCVVRRELGAGGMGVVYEADDLLLGRTVALKLLHGDAQGVERKARLLREAQALARLAHPNVVTVYDVGVEQGRVFLAMEYVDGGTLTELMRARPRSWEEILGAYRQAGLGLAAAHDAGIVHRDFKPSNALVAADGRICVTDFGLARLSAPSDVPALLPEAHHPLGDALTQSGTVLGSPAFMSPEQLLGQPADARSDIFSFCVALYADLYGERPFAGRTVGELREAIIGAQVRPRPSCDRVPEWLRRVLLRGLHADAAARPQTMRALLDELARERSAAGLDRAARILAEARSFFRHPDGGLAVSAVAVSLLEELMNADAGAPAATMAAVHPDLPRLPDVEIAGDRVDGILANFGPFRLLMSHFVLRERPFPTDASGNIRCDPTAWYPLEPFVTAMHRFERSFGADASYDVGFASSRHLVGGPATLAPADLATLLAVIDSAMMNNCRLDGRSDASLAAAIGRYELVEGGDGRLTVTSSSPWPCANDRGLLAGFVARVDPGAVLEHHPGPCRASGASRCRYGVRRRSA